MRSAGKPMSSRQMRSASSSSSWTVTHSRLGVDADDLGVEVPREADRVGLEVVAEAEVAEHLEEREVAVGAADVVEVVVLAARADALLHRDRPLVRRRLVAGEVALERDHARDREEQRRVDRDHARRRHLRVAARDEEIDEGASKLVGSGRTSLTTSNSGYCPALANEAPLELRLASAHRVAALVDGGPHRCRSSGRRPRSARSAAATRRSRRMIAHDEPSPSSEADEEPEQALEHLRRPLRGARPFGCGPGRRGWLTFAESVGGARDAGAERHRLDDRRRERLVGHASARRRPRR